ncbi:MAG: ABC transporter substrate-binding protein [Mesorhizobium sp.]
MNLKSFGIAAFGSLFLLGAAGAGELPQRIVDAGKFTLTINATFTPMEFVDPKTNTFVGLDIELVDAIAKRLGLGVTRTDGLFNQLIPALTTGRTDFILSGMIDNEERRKSFDFVNYMRAGAQFFVLTKSEVKDPVELCGKAVGTIRSAAYMDLLQAWNQKHCVDAGLKAMDIIGAESSPDVRLQLKQGRIEAGVQGGESIPYTSAQEGGIYRLIGEPLITAYYGAAFRKEDSAFRDKFADTLQELIDDGTYGAIFEKWKLTSHAIPKVMINSEPRK